MIIIVEGIDRVGKSTLCREICQELGYKLFRDSFGYFGNYNNMFVNSEKINTLQNLFDNGIIKDLVLDRYHLTEFIYGQTYRHYINSFMLDVDARLGKLDNICLVLVEPEDIWKSSQEHGRWLGQEQSLFDTCFDASKISRKFKTNYHGMGKMVEELKEICKNEK